MNVLVDTNVLLDVLSHREPHFMDSAHIWTLAESRRIDGFVSALSFPTIYYIQKKAMGRAVAERTLCSLRASFGIATCDTRIISQAIDANMPDFEDAVQYFCALSVQAEYIVSRDREHFLKSDIPVLSPREFLALHDSD